MTSHNDSLVGEHLRGGLFESSALLLGQRPAVLAALLGRRRRPRRLLRLLLPVCILQVALQEASPLSGGRLIAMYSQTREGQAQSISASSNRTAAPTRDICSAPCPWLTAIWTVITG